ncbi:fucosyltransferase [Pseudoalteromonas sp. A25]|uniref:glycosyltransferase family 2 protein n=1 Tax=Pseudoalteromonas sp. A25 TaxID=116092 RepID=UPI0012606831|nr:glycosyltransferase family 2 protein [Pseudoalteromonas sp. A25]BBN80400.1 fucosyltransferase [Pseudoalteromonas sp. A25]
MNISVVIPLFNKAEHVVRAVESVLQQTVPVKEVIVVDDGSEDGGATKVESLKYQNVLIHRQANHGVSHARNVGISLASGDFVAFLDADDYWLPNFIALITELRQLYPAGKLLCTGYEFKTKLGTKRAINSKLLAPHGLIDDYFRACCNEDLPITASSVCIEKNILEEVGGFPEDLKLGEDQVVWAMIACKWPIAYVQQSAVVYDLMASSSDQQRIDYVDPSPHLAAFKQLEEQSLVPDRMLNSLHYLQHLTVMSSIRSNLIHGRKRQAIRLLLTHTMLKWDFYRLSAFLLLLAPTSLNIWLLNKAKSLRV